MIPTIIKTDLIATQTQVTPITPVTPVTAIPDPQSSFPEFAQGQKYQALIETRLLNGNSRVLVAGKLLQMHLPDNFQPGNKLELVFISQEPKLKFLILNEAPFDTGKNNTSISTTGRFLGALMQDTLKQTPASITPTNTVTTLSLTSPTPILAGPSINSTELPGLLQKAIVQSGLFYESHQAQWVNGENTLENLQQEPQGKLVLVAADLPAAKVAASALLGPEMSVHTQTIPLVQQQLTTLETGHLFWRGEIWQGQPMEWDINEHSQEKEKENESDQVPQWRTQLRLSMPQLGDITATITLNAQGINIKINTSQQDTARLLKSNQSPLTMDMQLVGLNIQAVEVQHDDRE
ncbi:MAG: flagellar hook-length control protein FliK [Nitrosomonas sp.]|uniref:flagellar hook-length control protein FliK n=1 Tax=Nitrosomonas sp. TaxID=42353 RepID=UPI0027293A7B|nr:flagellar hook-length control protein FliK [Nitrosomonas sp.]MDO8894255.1 flagellar hook-length control protein FliK [Nitrosomonas sp.]MDP3280958.1 flagellar hook-length control protein FliK [Nitrosomonas sp.]MDP3662100.1 flagellar hook-length control protein FliK [Nitrosomonas sp.]MDZ4106745.1 flagellar hook-length control protein FliK [Nitrosomonas sp.]